MISGCLSASYLFGNTSLMHAVVEHFVYTSRIAITFTLRPRRVNHITHAQQFLVRRSMIWLLHFVPIPNSGKVRKRLSPTPNHVQFHALGVRLMHLRSILRRSHAYGWNSAHLRALQSCFTARCTLVQSAVLGLHVVRLSVCLSVRDVGGPWPHRLEILETNCTHT